MIGLLQRVTQASVEVAGATIAEIGPGLLVFVGVRPTDSEADARRLVERLLAYRIFPDDAGRMNLGLIDRKPAGGLLLVPQFTLAADTSSGKRPSFASAAAPSLARALFDFLVAEAVAHHPDTASGHFGADMRVHLVNDGPVTFWLET